MTQISSSSDTFTTQISSSGGSTFSTQIVGGPSRTVNVTIGRVAGVGQNGLSAYELAQQEGFAGTLQDYLSSLHGADGVTPVKGRDYDDGTDGKSAYELWLELPGNSGTAQDYQASLKGQPGYTPVKGTDYSDGQDGYTPRKGIDYTDGKDGAPGITPAEITELRNTITALQNKVTALENGGADTETPPSSVDYYTDQNGEIYTDQNGEGYYA